ncbi:hypothetical protein pdul_cds_376 [Pandoravirus dulcis]|uniref:Uncharacterized protein n=1 Tax=Pandoravirus dulcis TaxID=1349409 RepID=S4VSN1_9VIRU|nr:hypothetical protein pdul_cds_376 [Pandoravirus dulcis]AGO82410.1 hypothetical protein pdul_cds_376 [Pandoravirus dulcis]
MQAPRGATVADNADVSLLGLVLVSLAAALLGRCLAHVWRVCRAWASRRPSPPLPPRQTSYDLSIGIDSLADLAADGWVVRADKAHSILDAVRKRLTALCAMGDGDAFGQSNNDDDAIATAVEGHSDDERAVCDREIATVNRTDTHAAAPTQGSLVKTVGFLGARGVGKTFCINSLYGLALPCGPLHPTRGLGLVWPTAPGRPAIVDTAGDRAPAPANDATAAHDRRLTEALIQDVALHCADQLVLVVGDMTAADQARIASLAGHVARRGRRHLFVLHNLRHAGDVDECDRLWEDQVLTPYAAVGHLEHCGDRQRAHFVTTTAGGVHIYHMRLARAGTPAGDLINAHTCDTLRARLDAFGVAHPFDPCALVDQRLGDMLPCLVADFAGVEWHPEGALAGDALGDSDGLVARIRCRARRSGAPCDAALHLRPVPLSEVAAGGTAGAMSGSDFDVPVEVRDGGGCLAVRIDVPGVDPGSLTVTSLVGPRGQYAEVRGLRLLPPDDDEDDRALKDDRGHEGDRGDRALVGRHSRRFNNNNNNNNNNNDNDHCGHSNAPCKNDGGGDGDKDRRNDPEIDDRRPAAPARGKRHHEVPRSVVDPVERCGRLCVRIDMPPGSRVDASTIDCTYGVLSFKIRRQTQPIPLPVQKAPSVPAGPLA